MEWNEQKDKLRNSHRNSITKKKKTKNFRKTTKIYMTFGLVMSSNTQQKSQLTKLWI